MCVGRHTTAPGSRSDQKSRLGGPVLSSASRSASCCRVVGWWSRQYSIRMVRRSQSVAGSDSLSPGSGFEWMSSSDGGHGGAVGADVDDVSVLVACRSDPVGGFPRVVGGASGQTVGLVGSAVVSFPFGEVVDVAAVGGHGASEVAAACATAAVPCRGRSGEESSFAAGVDDDSGGVDDDSADLGDHAGGEDVGGGDRDTGGGLDAFDVAGRGSTRGRGRCR